jgi:hypothetical protein
MTHTGPRFAALMPRRAPGAGAPRCLTSRMEGREPAAQACAEFFSASASAARLRPAARQVSDDPGREELCRSISSPRRHQSRSVPRVS